MSRTRIATAEDVQRLAGDVGELGTARILQTGASVAELEEACAFAAGQTDVMCEARERLAGRIADIYDILTSSRMPDEDRE